MKRNLGGWIHSAYGWPNYLFWSAVSGVFIALGALNRADRLRHFGSGALGVFWGRMMWMTTPFWWRRWRGLHHLEGGPFVIVANHQSTIDIPCLYGLPIPLRISARPGIFHVPLMGRFLRWSGQIDTSRFLEEAQAMLDDGVSVVVFPEGSRSADGQVQRFHGGAFRLAVRSGRPILPIAMDGAQDIMSKRHYFAMRWWAVVRVHILAPLPAGEDAKTLMRTSRDRIAHALAEMRAGS